MENPRIYFAGTGGQGTLTATRLLGQAALLAGIPAIAGEIHGMAQRGGVVESTLLLGGWQAARIDVGEADILLGFEALETMRALPFLRRGGVVFSSTRTIPPLNVSLGKEQYPSFAELEEAVKSVADAFYLVPTPELAKAAPKSGNTVLLGALCQSGLLPFGTDKLAEAIEKVLPPKLHGQNLAAMQAGAQWFIDHK